MRRTLPEWLLLPLFLLPVVAGAVFCLYARASYRDDIEPYRRNGRQMAEEWLREASPKPDLGRTFDLVREHRWPAEGLVEFRWSGGSGSVFLPDNFLGPEAWLLADEYPTGLSAAALGDPEVRIEIEKGTAPASLAGVDPGTVALRDLAGEPDLDRLRDAPLPAMTKLFLVRRWLGDDPDLRDGVSVEKLLAALAELQRGLDLHGLPEHPGEHRFGKVRAILPDPGAPLLVLPEDPELVSSWIFYENEDRDCVWLCLTIPSGSAAPPRDPRSSNPAVWRGRLEAPIAGEWSFTLPYGHDWWRAPFFRAWAGPVAGLLLAYLVLPTALLLSIRRRRRLDEARARFINELAHDLRTPLTSLRLYSEMLAEGRAQEEDRSRYVDVLARESARVGGLMGNLLDLSRLERGNRKLSRERLDLDATVETAIRDFALLYPDRADDLRVEGPDDAAVTTDRTALSRCLANLLDNAGKFTEPGTPIRVSWEPDRSGDVVIRVADEGPGVPAGERSRLFRRFERGAAAVRDGVPGTGLGLSLVRELAEGMGGRVRHVATGKGAVFEIILPGGSHA
jgi:signal transduction histidine kinase